jgi:hypothetical protein
MKLLIRDHDNLFVLSELAHFSGIGFLVYKLLRVESCEGAGRAGLGLLHAALFCLCSGLCLEPATRLGGANRCACQRAWPVR